jgi:hypothetical protein
MTSICQIYLGQRSRARGLASFGRAGPSALRAAGRLQPGDWRAAGAKVSRTEEARRMKGYVSLPRPSYGRRYGTPRPGAKKRVFSGTYRPRLDTVFVEASAASGRVVGPLRVSSWGSLVLALFRRSLGSRVGYDAIDSFTSKLHARSFWRVPNGTCRFKAFPLIESAESCTMCCLGGAYAREFRNRELALLFPGGIIVREASRSDRLYLQRYEPSLG